MFGQLGFAFDGQTLYVRMMAGHDVEKPVSYEEFLAKRQNYSAIGRERRAKKNEQQRLARIGRNRRDHAVQAPGAAT